MNIKLDCLLPHNVYFPIKPDSKAPSWYISFYNSLILHYLLTGVVTSSFLDSISKNYAKTIAVIDDKKIGYINGIIPILPIKQIWNNELLLENIAEYFCIKENLVINKKNLKTENCKDFYKENVLTIFEKSNLKDIPESSIAHLLVSIPYSSSFLLVYSATESAFRKFIMDKFPEEKEKIDKKSSKVLIDIIFQRNKGLTNLLTTQYGELWHKDIISLLWKIQTEIRNLLMHCTGRLSCFTEKRKEELQNDIDKLSKFLDKHIKELRKRKPECYRLLIEDNFYNGELIPGLEFLDKKIDDYEIFLLPASTMNWFVNANISVIETLYTKYFTRY